MIDYKIQKGKKNSESLYNNNWNEYKITQLGSVYPGLKGKTKKDFGKGKKFISYMNVYSNPQISLDIKDLVDVKVTESQNVVMYGDIFFTTSSETPNEVAMSSVLLDEDIGEIYLNSFCFGYRLNNFETLLPEFAKYYFRSPNFRRQINRIAQGAIRYNLSKKYFLEERIVIPPLEEQKQIVSVIEKWDKYIELLDQKIQIKKNVKKYLQQVLLTRELRLDGFNGSWQEHRLGDIVKLNKGEQLGKLQMIENGKYPVLNGGITYSGNTDSWNVPAGTVTISEGGNSCGHVNYIMEKFWSGGHCYSLELYPDKILAKYLFFMLKQDQTKIMRLRVGSGLPNIQRESLKNFMITLPPLDEQKAIASILSKSDEEISMLEKQRDVIEEQRKYLINNLVTGKIRLPKFRN